MNLKQQIGLLISHPLAMGSFTNWLNLLIHNGGVDKKYIPKALYISLISCLGIPLRIIERVKYNKKVENLEIQYQPIFILGHWRSGTTYLHHLISQDPNLGYVSTGQASAPEMFLAHKKVLNFISNNFRPKTRLMDNVESSNILPEEEEYAVGNISPYSFIHGVVFSKNISKYFQDIVLFHQVSEESKLQWKNYYINVLKKATLHMDSKRLVLKNPPNTARVKLLLEMFPTAKFIHIYRNPYIVYASTKHLSQNLLPAFALQEISEQELDENILNFYQQLMHKFFAEQSLIPKENLIEIKYEDFVCDELAQLRKIYEHLNLPNFEKAKGNFKKYIDAHSNYETNKYLFDEETIAKVYDAWKFTIDKWQYSPPQSS
ncbi:sulfotransferase [Nostoc sp. ChiQUE01b]|uniref:sulfotransferase family protein n=1 Tax=Nostoc sp. ChiQUE01b TaxID=3075376 RepID=UPI002AD4EE81|nr:sulfotransferase [Nostoc sp. ChiQUE01b]MDZ8262754.1 sulfotransferase [Nostoc sp. ChiQUE01b]